MGTKSDSDTRASEETVSKGKHEHEDKKKSEAARRVRFLSRAIFFRESQANALAKNKKKGSGDDDGDADEEGAACPSAAFCAWIAALIKACCCWIRELCALIASSLMYR